jgi:signal peptide peptidase SppA
MPDPIDQAVTLDTSVDATDADSQTPDEHDFDPQALAELGLARNALRAGRRYSHVARFFYERPWALHEDWMRKVDAVLTRRMAGIRLTADEIAAATGRRADAGGDGDGGGDCWYQVGSVAVIPVFGVISQRASMFDETSTPGGTSVDECRMALREALADPTVAAVVLDFDSPGGSVDGLTEFCSELRAASAGAKPVVAQVDMLCASAAYWLAAQCSEIVCSPSGEVGSVGIYSAHQDTSAAEAMDGVKTTLVSAGPYKTEGNPHEPLTDAARSQIQSHVDTFYAMFLNDVAKGRGVSPDAVASGYGEGRTLLAGKAKAAGMVDRIGSLEDTVRRMQGSAPSSKPAAAATVTPIRRAEQQPAPDLAAMRAFNARNRDKRSTPR